MLPILPYSSYSLFNGRLPSNFLSFCNVCKSLYPIMVYKSENICLAQCNAELHECCIFIEKDFLYCYGELNELWFSSSYIIKNLYLLKIAVSRKELDCSTWVLNWTSIFISTEASAQARREKYCWRL